MRVAIVLSGLGAGGAERVVALLARTWIARGWKVSVICFQEETALVYHELPSEARIIWHPPPDTRSKPRAAIDLLGRILFLRRVLANERPDVVISFRTKINGLALLANLGSRRPLLICERDTPERRNVRRGWHFLQGRLANRATLVVQTEASRRAHVARGQLQVRVIPNPIEAPVYLADHSVQTIVAVGRFVEQKGFDLLLRAFAVVAPAHPNWKLIIWGEGPMRGVLEELRDALGLGASVTFPGLTEQPGQWVLSGSVFVLSSRHEGFPNVLVEAMSAGMAVAAFDCPFGPSEIIHDGEDGFLLPPEDETALAQCLETLMNDPALRIKTGQAAARNVERFALDRVSAQWDQVIAEAIEAAGGTFPIADMTPEERNL